MINLIFALAAVGVIVGFMLNGWLKKASEEGPEINGQVVIYSFPMKIKLVGLLLLLINGLLLVYFFYTRLDAMITLILLVMLLIVIYSSLDYMNSKLEVEQRPGNKRSYKYTNTMGQLFAFTSDEILEVKSDGKKMLFLQVGEKKVPFKFGWIGRSHFLEQVQMEDN